MESVSDIRAGAVQELTSSGVRRGEHLLLALSGGVDSLALLDILLSIAPGAGLKIQAAHLDHSVRGEQSEKDALEVESLCAKRNIPIVMGKLQRSEVRIRKGELNSLEAALRELRYEFLYDAAGKTGADWIVTAHHSDDQAETVLFRALRRMNWRSFTGMKAVKGSVLRPLLNATRIDLESYCCARGLKHLEDETNLDLSFSRNRLRHQVILELEKSFHPSIKSMLLKVSDHCVRLENWERNTIDNITPEDVPSLHDPGFGVAQYISIPAPLREGLALKLLESVLDVRPKASLLSQTMKMLSGRAEGTVRLPGGAVLEFEDGQVKYMGSGPERHSGQRIRVAEKTLDIPGSLVVSELGRKIHTDFESYDGQESFPGGDDALLNAEKMRLPLVVRNRRPKDTFQPLGMKREKKLKEFLIDRKVSRRSRDMLPLVFDADRVLVWVAGVEISEAVRLEKGVRARAIRLRVEKIQDAGH